MRDAYVLATGEKAAERLEFQSSLGLYWQLDHLNKAGIKEGMSVIDIGCGVGAMTTHLAKLVGPLGKVYAVDGSKEQLEIAKNKANSEGLTNIEFIHSDIYSIQELLIGKADIIYIRFVLMHLTQPVDAVKIIKNYLKPNGVIASQESILKTFDWFSDQVEIVSELGNIKNVDYNIGERTEDIFKQAEFERVEVEYKQLKLNYENFKKFVLISLYEWKDKAIEAGVLDEAKVALWEDELYNMSSEVEYTLAKHAYVIASNPTRILD